MARLERRTLRAAAGPMLAGAALGALALVLVVFALTRQGVEAAASASQQELARAHAVQSRWLSERLARQELGALALAAEHARGTDAAPPRWLLARFDLVAVVDPEGRVVAGGGSPPGDPAALAERFRDGSGLVAAEGRLHALAGVEVPGPEPRAVALVGEQLDGPFARDVGDAITVDLAYVLAEAAGPRVAASTLSQAGGDELTRALRRLGDWNHRIEQASRTRFELEGRSHVALLSPLRSGGRLLGAVVTLTPEQEMPPLSRRARATVLALGLGGLAAVAAATLWAGVGLLRPLGSLCATLVETRLEAVAPRDENPGGPAEVVAAAERRLRAEGARAALGARARQAALGVQRGGSGARLLAGPAVVLAIDLRRFAPLAAARHPDLALARYADDRDRVARTLALRGGELAAVAGHRLLGVFPREAVTDALVAAVEIGRLLRQSDSALDEPVPPAIALAEGDLVRGRIGEGLRAQRVVLGRAVQETDALLREAMPGDILFAGPLRERLAEPLAEAGVEVAEQRAMLFPQPIHRVDLERAAALGRDQPVDEPLLEAGVVLGGRFELDGRLGETPEGRLYAGHDRSTGSRVEVLVLGTGEWGPRPMPVERLTRLLERSRGLGPGVVEILDGGLVGERLFVASAAAPGPTLDAVIAAGEGLPEAPALELAGQLARGLAAVHRAGLVHHALRPDRVVVGLDGTVALRTAGVAPLLAGVGGWPPAEVARYRAPELDPGDDAAGAAADLYSWGAVVRFALRASAPYEDGEADPTPAPGARGELPARLGEAVRRCLAADPADRFADADQLVAFLAEQRRADRGAG
ncbi:MAG TPA: hypothetical protein VMV46_11770 [Thermoanaerobaculia bacterium]|nr:hypothetical protein [Thermoanaerobaculia bacterium]